MGDVAPRSEVTDMSSLQRLSNVIEIVVAKTVSRRCMGQRMRPCGAAWMTVFELRYPNQIDA